MKKGKKKSKDKVLLKGKIILSLLCFLLVILLFIFGFYIFKVINGNNSNNFKIESRAESLKDASNKSGSSYKPVGWLRVQGTNIDYPIYFSLVYNFENLADDHFAWTYGDFTSLNNIIYISGHNIKNLSQHPLIANEKHSRFEQLMSFVYYDFAKDNQFMQYTFNGQDYVYQIFSVSFVDSYDIDIFNNIPYSKEQMSEYIDEVSKKSLYKYDIDVNENDKLISLDTCTRMFGSNSTSHLRVVGRLLRDGESISLSDVSEKKNYDKIKNILEGGDSYDET